MKKATFLLLSLYVLAPLFPQNNGNTSIAMLNYLATETRVINGSKNNRLVLEEIYNKLINNTNPSIVDETTKDYLQTMLDIIENFRVITLQRERLKYIFENQQAQAITQALPNPLYLLGARDKNPLSLIATAAAMTIDSVFKFQNATNSAELDFLKGNWELDDKESAELHTLRSRAFGYMVDIARINNLSMTDTLNERSIDNFVNYTLDENLQRRRQTLEGNRALYTKYAPYWIVLAETYCDLGLYRESIDAIHQYELVYAPILRKDSDLARILPKVIVAISNVYGTNAIYLNLTKTYLEKLVLNTTEADWALRYFAAQTYISMAGIDNRRQNLTAAYNLLVGNVTYLSREQEALLDKYVRPIDETIPHGTAKEKEKQMKDMIKKLKDMRKKELPPSHEGLLTNYQTLIDIMKELNVPQRDRDRINAIVDKSFINPEFRHVYFLEPYNSDNIILSFDWFFDTLDFVLPITYLTENMEMNFSIFDDYGNYFRAPNWYFELSSIRRGNTGSISDYSATVFLWLKENLKFEKKEKYTIFIDLVYGELVTRFRFEKIVNRNNIRLIRITHHEKSDLI